MYPLITCAEPWPSLCPNECAVLYSDWIDFQTIGVPIEIYLVTDGAYVLPNLQLAEKTQTSYLAGFAFLFTAFPQNHLLSHLSHFRKHFFFFFFGGRNSGSSWHAQLGFGREKPPDCHTYGGKSKCNSCFSIYSFDLMHSQSIFIYLSIFIIIC